MTITDNFKYIRAYKQRFSVHFTPENIEFMAKHAYLTTVIMQKHKKKFKKQHHITYDFITQNPYSEGLNRGILKNMRSITFSKTKRVYLIQNVDKFKKTLCLRLIQHSWVVCFLNLCLESGQTDSGQTLERVSLPEPIGWPTCLWSQRSNLEQTFVIVLLNCSLANSEHVFTNQSSQIKMSLYYTHASIS